ncbi:hypothetical protein [Halorientalis salina]|uniref:hypothetical protein n=1 Tax=Halorientalis salina TaxID=2932266 RepID=UPI0010AC26DB|nr:hypothetical protein [Halorientalis salina]
MGDWSVEIDEERSRIYLTLSGYLELSEHEKVADAVTEAAIDMDGGFDLVNDMSSFEPASEDAMAEIKRGKRGLAENGMEAAVRVVSESTTGQMQFDRAGEGVENYQLAKANSIDEAEKLLDSRGD